MRGEGITALANTAATSNLGQMLVRICLKDGVPLLNIVRSAEQAQLLTAMGARYVCNSSASTFLDELTEAFAATGATIAFDAIGGGKLPGQLLTCMEAALIRKATTYSRYGSTTHKQVYIYGGLHAGPTQLLRRFRPAWGVGGLLVTPFLPSLQPPKVAAPPHPIAPRLTTHVARS